MHFLTADTAKHHRIFFFADAGKQRDFFDFLMMWFRDVLYFKATADVDQLIFTREISAIRAQASSSSYGGLQEILNAIDRCAVRLRSNVNFELALELLLSSIKENCNA